METVALHAQEIGDSGQPLIILHGLFGSGDNWRTLGMKWAEKYRVFLVDQRNHGRSPHHNEWTYEAMAADLERFIRERNIERPLVLGHSMGGKTVMEMAARAEVDLCGIVVADMAPVQYSPHHTEILKALNSVDLSTVDKREEVDEALKPDIPEFLIRQFLLKGLLRTAEGEYRWKFNLEVITSQYDGILSEVAQGALVDMPALFIYGGKSPYVNEEGRQVIEQKFSQAEFHCIEEASHWLHAEAPQVFYREVSRYLENYCAYA